MCFSLGVTCGFLIFPENGQVNVISVASPVGTVARYECDAGFIISGSSARTCGTGGNWSGIEPICECELLGVSNRALTVFLSQLCSV